MGFWEGFFAGSFLSGDREGSEGSGGGCGLFLLTIGIIGGGFAVYYLWKWFQKVISFFHYLYTFPFVRYFFFPSTFDSYLNLQIHPFLLGLIFLFIIYIFEPAANVFSRFLDNKVVFGVYSAIGIVLVPNMVVMAIRMFYLIPWGVLKWIIHFFI